MHTLHAYAHIGHRYLYRMLMHKSDTYNLNDRGARMCPMPPPYAPPCICMPTCLCPRIPPPAHRVIYPTPALAAPSVRPPALYAPMLAYPPAPSSRYTPLRALLMGPPAPVQIIHRDLHPAWRRPCGRWRNPRHDVVPEPRCRKGPRWRGRSDSPGRRAS
jgi:hypothetical protein